MSDLNYLAVLAAAVLAFVLSSAYYAALGHQMGRLHDAYADAGTPPPWKILVELLRSLVVAAVVAGLADRTGSDAWTEALVLAVVLWVGFPIALWTGAVIWERVPLKLSAIHAGDWLIKLVAVSVIVSLWR